MLVSWSFRCSGFYYRGLNNYQDYFFWRGVLIIGIVNWAPPNLFSLLKPLHNTSLFIALYATQRSLCWLAAMLSLPHSKLSLNSLGTQLRFCCRCPVLLTMSSLVSCNNPFTHTHTHTHAHPKRVKILPSSTTLHSLPAPKP